MHICLYLWCLSRLDQPVCPSFMFNGPDVQSDRCRRGKAKVHILDFKTTWSEFQEESQTATEQSKAELRILNSKIK